MKLIEYHSAMQRFAVYPDFVINRHVGTEEKLDNEFVYPLVGLYGEFGELAEKVKKTIRGQDIKREEILKEAGDFLWYLNRIIYIDKYLPIGVIKDSLEMFGVHNVASFSLCINYLLNLGEVVSQISMEIALLVGGGHQDESRRRIAYTNAFRFLGRVLSYYDYTIEDAMELNICKLTSREERNVLVGEGDNR